MNRVVMNWCRAIALCVLVHGATSVAADARLDEAVRNAIAATESRVVQLRYFGATEGPLGATTPQVTGYDLGEGWVITSLYGLAAAPAAIVCRRPGEDRLEAQLVACDLSRGLALLRCGEKPTAEPRVLGRPARVGETAIALGRAFESDRVNLALGVVSAVGRLGGRAVQTDAAASPVNYGGPLVGLDGQLLGIITPLQPPGQSGVGLYDSGIGFAVPASQIAPRLPSLTAGIDVRPGWMGVSQAKSDPLRNPAELLSVSPNGPAASAGLQDGDVITRLGETPTPTGWALRGVLSGLDAGQAVAVRFDRQGRTLGPIHVTLAEKPAETKSVVEDVSVQNSESQSFPKRNQPDQP